MSTFLIGEVEEMTGVKAHTLRYWEEIIPFLSPVKDSAGRRLYSNTDVRLILRLNYLITNKKYSIEGAQQHIIAETNLTGLNEALIPELNSIRSDLLDLYVLLRNKRKGTE